MKVASLLFPHEATHDAAHVRDVPAPARRPAWPVALLGIPFANLTTAAAVEQLGGLVATRRAHRVMIAGLETLLQAQSDHDLRRELLGADVVLCESRSLVAASALLGNRLPGKIPAPDLIRRLLRLSVARQYRVFLVDDEPGAAGLVGAELERMHPGLRVVGTYSLSMHSLPSERLVHAVRESQPDIILAHAPSPTVSRWLATRQAELHVPLLLPLREPLSAACGLAPAAVTVRAPRPFESLRRHARTFIARFRRCVTCLPSLAGQWWHSPHWPSRGRADPAVLRADGGWLEMDAAGDLTRSSCDRHAAFWRLAASGTGHCALLVSHVEHIDATGLAVLAEYRASLARTGRHLVLIAPSATLRDALADARLASHFTTAASLAEARKLVPDRNPVAQPGCMRSLAWCGEIIVNNADDVWQLTSEYIRTFSASGATLVLIDLSRLRHIDAMGAALMWRIKRWSRERKTEVMFVHPQPRVFGALQLLQLDHVLLEGGQ